MKKIYTLLSLVLFAVSAFAATEPAWYNDVTSIAANGQYYIYSVKGKGFVQGGQSKVKAVNTNNYNTESGLLFIITKQDAGKTYSGSNYLSAYQAGTCGPVGSSSTNGSDIVWTSMSNGDYWNIHGKYSFLGTKYAALKYSNSYDASANVWGNKETQTGEEFRWYLISQAHYDRHWAIYLYDRYKDNIADYTKWENLVPAAYYAALAQAYAVSFDVKNAEHSKEVVSAHRSNLTALYDGAADIAAAYATATAAINALEAVEDKGEDFADVTTDIANARTAIEQAMTVEAVNASVAGLKAIDPVTFNQTIFDALSFVTEAASSAAGRQISYAAVDETIINAEGKAVYKGTTTLTATAAATDAYYKFVRSAEVTVNAADSYSDFNVASCGEPVEFHDSIYTEATNTDVNVGLNWIGGDSIVHLSIVFNQPSDSTDFLTIVYGDSIEWNGNNLNDSTVGEHVLKYVTTNAAGCDSTVTLYLTVEKQQTLEQPVDLSFCEGDSAEYRGKWYTEATNDTILAIGDIRDTLYIVNVTMLLPSFSTDSLTIVYGDSIEWNGNNLNDSTVGEHVLTYVTTNAAGCDSTATLYLTVEKQQTLEQPVDLSFCEGDSAEYRGKWYTEAANDTILAIGDIRDTLYIVNVTMLLPSFSTDSLTIVYGDSIEWNGNNLNDSTVGDHVLTYVTTNAAGCDSTATLYLTVVKLAPYELEQELSFCEGDSVEFNGKWYTEAGVDTLYFEDAIRDTILYVSVAVLPTYVIEWGSDTITVGDTLYLESIWYLGDSLLGEIYVAQEADTIGLTFVRYSKSLEGCDSTLTFHITVLPKETETPETPETPTAIEQVRRNTEIIKEFRNGVIYIRREGKTYTTSGLLVE